MQMNCPLTTYPLSNSVDLLIIDPEDYLKISKYSWAKYKYGTKYYASTGRILLHRFIMGCKPFDGRVIDHINGNILDNRKSNLRFCTRKQNIQNSKKRNCKTSSKYKGVSWCKRDKRWRAYIGNRGKNLKQSLGYFKNEIEAAKAYNEKAKELFGEFACLNKII